MNYTANIIVDDEEIYERTWTGPEDKSDVIAQQTASEWYWDQADRDLIDEIEVVVEYEADGKRVRKEFCVKVEVEVRFYTMLGRTTKTPVE